MGGGKHLRDHRLPRDVGKEGGVLELGEEVPYHFDWIGGEIWGESLSGTTCVS